MNYKKLGNSDLLLSEVSFGCMSLEDNDVLTEKLVHEAFDLGVNYFDTADLYQKGRNEELVGKALKKYRNQVCIGTKVGNQWRPDGSGWDWNPSKKHILKAVDESLKRLQTDYIDVYQLHGGTIDDPMDDTIEAFEILKEKGKIRFYGISSIRPNVIREWVKRSNMTSVMMQYSLLDRRPEEESLSLLEENNIGVLARGTLAKGLLVNKEPEKYLGFDKEQILKLQRELGFRVHIDKKYHAAIDFVLHHESISSATIGIRTNDQLKQLQSFLNDPITSSKTIEDLKYLFPEIKYQNHR